jgi:hypothetical protein
MRRLADDMCDGEFRRGLRLTMQSSLLKLSARFKAQICSTQFNAVF